MSGTDLAFAATRDAFGNDATQGPDRDAVTCKREVSSAICLRVCYVMSGTDKAYGAVRYAISGADIHSNVGPADGAHVITYTATRAGNYAVRVTYDGTVPPTLSVRY
eukprot:2111125-Rhodomonas_salina.3